MKLDNEKSSLFFSKWKLTVKYMPWLVLVVGLSLTYYLQRYAFQVAHQSLQNNFDIEVRTIDIRIERRLAT